MHTFNAPHILSCINNNMCAYSLSLSRLTTHDSRLCAVPIYMILTSYYKARFGCVFSYSH